MKIYVAFVASTRALHMNSQNVIDMKHPKHPDSIEASALVQVTRGKSNSEMFEDIPAILGTEWLNGGAYGNCWKISTLDDAEGTDEQVFKVQFLQPNKLRVMARSLRDISVMTLLDHPNIAKVDYMFFTSLYCKTDFSKSGQSFEISQGQQIKPWGLTGADVLTNDIHLHAVMKRYEMDLNTFLTEDRGLPELVRRTLAKLQGDATPHQDLFSKLVDHVFHMVNDIMIQILEALAYLAALGLIHSDLKPNNILIDSVNDTRGLPRVTIALTDFGHVTIPKTQVETVVTPYYRPPEAQMICPGKSQPITTKLDVFAAGVIGIELMHKAVECLSTVREVPLSDVSLYEHLLMPVSKPYKYSHAANILVQTVRELGSDQADQEWIIQNVAGNQAQATELTAVLRQHSLPKFSTTLATVARSLKSFGIEDEKTRDWESLFEHMTKLQPDLRADVVTAIGKLNVLMPDRYPTPSTLAIQAEGRAVVERIPEMLFVDSAQKCTSEHFFSNFFDFSINFTICGHFFLILQWWMVPRGSCFGIRSTPEVQTSRLSWTTSS